MANQWERTKLSSNHHYTCVRFEGSTGQAYNKMLEMQCKEETERSSS